MVSSMVTSRCLYLSGVRACWNNPVPPSGFVLLALILAQTGNGIYPVLVKKFNGSANPLIFSMYRDVLAVPVLLLCVLVAERRLKIPNLKEMPLFALLGVLGMFSSQFLYILGVYHVGPNIATVFQQLIPIYGSLLAIITCTEKIPPANKAFTWFKIVGILLAAGGAVEMMLTGGLVAEIKGHRSEWYMLLGYLFLFSNSFCTAIYVMLQKKYIFMGNSPWANLPVSVTMWSYCFGALSMGLASIYYCTQPEVFQLPVEAAYSLVYAVMVTSAFCYLLTTWGNLHLPSTVVTAFWPFQVPVAVIISYFVTGDELKPLQYIGALLIIVGLCLVVYATHKEEQYHKQNGHTLAETMENFGSSNPNETTKLLNSDSRVTED